MSRNQLLSLVSLCSLSLLAACGADSSDAGVGYGGGFDSGGGVPSDQGGGIQAGTLTAGDWDDNLNFDIYQEYVAKYKAGDASVPSIPTEDRIVIKVVSDAGDPISNALVKVAGADQTFLTAPTASDGRVLFFPTHDGAAQETAFTVSVEPPPGASGVDPISVPAPDSATDWTIVLPGAQKNLPRNLDLAFVIDATGSMGDEMGYLQVEVQGIADRIKAEFDGVSIRYGLVVYRDINDQYVTRHFDFTPDLATFKAKLNEQSAGGGGDFPEAMDAAMKIVPELSWSTNNAVRMSFLMADAPPHKENRAAFLGAVDVMRPMGVKLFPIAASGVDSEAEFLMRMGAQATLGRHLFLTDDSGVGNSHMEPTIPCYQVQKLNNLVYRVIASELSGYRIPADPAEIVRSVGNPEEGVCKLDDGSFAYL
ncbi:MAG: VWA domain-containing protein [Polyangiaceae bacterium]|nr:VWA domain-containing protein [Polyangiaceae bacterium]